MVAEYVHEIDEIQSNSASLSRSQQETKIVKGSDDFLDIVLEFKGSIEVYTERLGNLNERLYVHLVKKNEGLLELIPSLKDLLSSSNQLMASFKRSVLGDSLKGALAKLREETSQLKEIIEDSEKYIANPNQSARLQSLFAKL